MSYLNAKALFLCLIFHKKSLEMESIYFINLIFIFAVNVFFFFSGICLNSLVILSFWRSVQLRKKLCYFMIMVLSRCDLLAVLTNSPLIIFVSNHSIVYKTRTISFIYSRSAFLNNVPTRTTQYP